MCRLFGMSGGPNRVGATFWLLEAPDSERFFALITRQIETTGDVAEGVVSATRWVAEHCPVYALNFVLIAADQLWAMRYPEVHELHVLERLPGGTSRNRHLEHASAPGSIRVRSGDLARLPAVVVASEQMDEDPGWRALRSGELLHVDGELKTTVIPALNEPPAHQLTLADLGARATSSQAAGSRTGSSQATTPAA